MEQKSFILIAAVLSSPQVRSWLHCVFLTFCAALLPQGPPDLCEIKDGAFAVAVCDCLGAPDSIYDVL